MSSRIGYLDGLRGLAILLVVFYHAFTRWAEMVPTGESLADVAMFKYGWVGVQLFFLISGFVILMTLERCQSFSEYFSRRWLRLFPGMLICSLLVFFTAEWFAERPNGLPQAVDLLPGLTFIEPGWWQSILDRPVGEIEGTYWSLYVEFKFYVIAGLLFFWRGAKAVVFGCALAYVFGTVVLSLEYNYPTPVWQGLADIVTALSFKHFGWFAAGAAFYLFFKNWDWRWYGVGVLFAAVCAVMVRHLSAGPALAAVLVSALFAASLILPRVQQWLQNPVLLLLGFVSYPLYLFHESTLIASLVKLGSLGLPLPAWFLPLPVIALQVLVAYLIARYGERLLTRWLKTGVTGMGLLPARPTGAQQRKV